MSEQDQNDEPTVPEVPDASSAIGRLISKTLFGIDILELAEQGGEAASEIQEQLTEQITTKIEAVTAIAFAMTTGLEPPGIDDLLDRLPSMSIPEVQPPDATPRFGQSENTEQQDENSNQTETSTQSNSQTNSQGGGSTNSY